jgi:hypothetical protein
MIKNLANLGPFFLNEKSFEIVFLDEKYKKMTKDLYFVEEHLLLVCPNTYFWLHNEYPSI